MSSNILIDHLFAGSADAKTQIHPLVRELGLTLGGVVAIALMAQVAMPLPFTPVPITGQTLAVLLIGASFGAWRALRTTAAYVVLGAAGLPIFAQAGSGFGAVFGMTGGYLFGFMLAAVAMGWIAERGYFRHVKSAVPLFLLGHLCIFVCGLAVLGVFVGFDQVLALGLYPFVPGLIVKTGLAGLVLPSLYKLTRTPD